jgi:DnaJ-class molecular chaperone
MKAVRLEKNDYLFIDMEDPETGPFALEIYRDRYGTLQVKSAQTLEARLTGDRHTLVGSTIEVRLDPRSPCLHCKGGGEDPELRRVTSSGTDVADVCRVCNGTGRRGKREDGAA